MPLDMQKTKVRNAPIRTEPEYAPEHILEEPHDMLLDGPAPNELNWRGPEHTVREKSKTWYVAAVLIIAAISIYALVTNNPIVAITFILIGAVGYLQLRKEPATIDFSLTPTGVVVGRQFFEYENIESFWIFYNPPHEKDISLRLKHGMIPYVHIPIYDQDPVLVREIMERNIPEIKQDYTILDILERVLHI